jgi:hypothetical protein
MRKTGSPVYAAFVAFQQRPPFHFNLAIPVVDEPMSQTRS